MRKQLSLDPLSARAERCVTERGARTGLFLLHELKLQHDVRSGIILLVLSLKQTPKPGRVFCPRSTR